MKLILKITLILLSVINMNAKENQDVFIDTKHPLYVHMMVCANVQDMKFTKQVGIVSNFKDIQDGKYYFTIDGVNIYSYNIKKVLVKEKDFNFILLDYEGTNGTSKKIVRQNNKCLISKSNNATPRINNMISTQILEPSSADFNRQLAYLTSKIGTPIFEKGKFVSKGLKSKEQRIISKLKQTNDIYLDAIDKRFDLAIKSYFKSLKVQLKKAIKNANNKDGFIERKRYAKIKEPKKMTEQNIKKYEKKLLKRKNKMDKDLEIQAGYSWFFSKIDKGARLLNITKLKQSKMIFVNNIPQKTLTLRASFDNGQVLDLDFIIKTTQSIDKKVFYTEDEIKNNLNTFTKILTPNDANKFNFIYPIKNKKLFFNEFIGN